MIDEMLKPLNDSELAQLAAKAQAEIVAREAKRREDVIAKIKELANTAGVSVHIHGTRGRPPARNGSRKSARATQAK